jgi:hypothetical protein
MTPVKKRECLTGHLESRIRRRGAAAKADSGAAVPVAAAMAMEAEEAATKGVAAMDSMERTTQPITAAKEAVTTTLDTRAGGRRATNGG